MSIYNRIGPLYIIERLGRSAGNTGKGRVAMRPDGETHGLPQGRQKTYAITSSKPVHKCQVLPLSPTSLALQQAVAFYYQCTSAGQSANGSREWRYTVRSTRAVERLACSGIVFRLVRIAAQIPDSAFNAG